MLSTTATIDVMIVRDDAGQTVPLAALSLVAAEGTFDDQALSAKKKAPLAGGA
jgi:hypothetical protein